LYKAETLTSLLSDQQILIAGYGREGQSTHRLLGCLLPNNDADVAHNDEEIVTLLGKKKYDLIIKSPGIPTMKFEGLCELDTLTSQTDLFLQVYGDQTIGVTGTKGKSTTTSLIHYVLSHGLCQSAHALLAGNIGIPLFDILDQLDERSIVVAELSCHQLENIHRAPHIGVILNLYQEHLDHYHDYRGYQLAKMRMMLEQQAGDHCFYCTDSDDLTRVVEEFKPVMSTTLHPYSIEDAHQAGADTLQTTLKGDHNVSNIFVAKQICELMGVSNRQFEEALAMFQGLPHRLELVGTYHGITFYNDSISTIPQATIAAMKALPNVETLILGGYDRGIDYGKIISLLVFATEGLHNVAFVGEAGRRILKELGCTHHGLPDRIAVLQEDDYKKVVDWCFRVTTSGKTCLLSPAAASYDSFKNFEERGETFKQLVRTHK
jgi:UDP-N-acetylmuramoylalanine--D-glutamate ligase